MHGVYQIERISGFSDANLSRVTKAPWRSHGSYTRMGGIADARDNVLSAGSNRLFAYDQLGHTALITDAGDEIYFYDGKTGPIAKGIIAGDTPHFFHGGNVVLTHGDDIDGAIFSAPDGNLHSDDWSNCLTTDLFPLAHTGSGTPFVAKTCVTILLVGFFQAANGWVPFGYEVLNVKDDSNDFDAYLSATVSNACDLGGCKVKLNIYVAYSVDDGLNPCTETGINGWFKYGEWQMPANSGESVTLKKSDISDPNAVPVFLYGTGYPSVPHKRSTYANGRSFHLDSGFAIRYECNNACSLPSGYEVEHFSCATNRRVYFSAPGYLGFSDYSVGPGSFLIDEAADAVVPSSRGVYVAGETAIYEAYGDFETQNTRIQRLPIAYGVSTDVVENVAYAGDVSYFVKEPTVFSLGASGFNEVGAPLALGGRKPRFIYYDVLDDKLYYAYQDGNTGNDDCVIARYDPIRKTWDEFLRVGSSKCTEWDSTGTGIARMKLATPQEYDAFEFAVNHDLINSTTPTNRRKVLLEYRGVDLGQVGRRVRVHRLLIPFTHTEYKDLKVRIRGHGNMPWQSCTPIVRNGFIEARCPTISDYMIDFSVEVEGDGQYLINPPILVEYEARSPKHGEY